MSNAKWSKVESAFRDLFEREWYTNHGPLAQKFEKDLQDYLSIENAVCVTNSGIALTMALEVLQINGSIKVYGEESLNLSSGLYWSGIHGATQNKRVASVLVSELDGKDIVAAIEESTKNNCPLILDLTQHSEADSLEKVSNFFTNIEISCSNPVLAVLSFDKGHAIEAQGAACIATNDMMIAERLRNIRSSYGVRQKMPVVKTANGRMSEAQAVFGLVSIEGLMSCD